MSNLPKKETPEAKTLIKEYLSRDDVGVDELARKSGYKTRRHFMKAMEFNYGAQREGKVELKENLPPIINIPEIKILKYEPRTTKGSPETQVLCLGDWHYGEITPTFNPSVADQRLDNLFKATVRIAELHRNMYPVNDLVIFMLGDMIHGENPFQGAKVGAIKEGAFDQVWKMAFPKALSLICSLKENFESVKVYCVDGNHGKVSRESADTSNHDRNLYQALKNAQLPKGIDIFLPQDFCQFAEINGWKFMIHHGDAIKASNGIPYFAQYRKVMSWYQTYNGFDFCVQGHFHKNDLLTISSKIKQINNGALVSDDPYALKVIGTSSIPAQTTFGVSSKHGLTWMYSLDLELVK